MPTRESDNGSYECFAWNSVGLAVSVAANLFVVGQYFDHITEPLWS